MQKEEFQKFFVENLEFFTGMGIYHYNSDRAKEVHQILNLFDTRMQSLISRVEALESKKRRVKNE